MSRHERAYTQATRRGKAPDRGQPGGPGGNVLPAGRGFATAAPMARMMRKTKTTKTTASAGGLSAWARRTAA